TPGTARSISASRRRLVSRFQPGAAAIQACTGASPSPLGICGLPPARSFGVPAGVDDGFDTALRGFGACPDARRAPDCSAAFVGFFDVVLGMADGPAPGSPDHS